MQDEETFTVAEAAQITEMTEDELIARMVEENLIWEAAPGEYLPTKYALDHGFMTNELPPEGRD